MPALRLTECNILQNVFTVFQIEKSLTGSNNMFDLHNDVARCVLGLKTYIYDWAPCKHSTKSEDMKYLKNRVNINTILIQTPFWFLHFQKTQFKTVGVEGI